MIQYLLDSGDPEEFKAIATLAKEHNEVLFGATTNPTLVAKKLAGKKVSQGEAFELQKQIVLEITTIVPGPVSAEVYADEKTTADEMAQQGREMSKWHERVVVKLPTTIEGFMARTILRREKVAINNTLIFSPQQVFAVCLHEKLIQKEFTARQESDENMWPPFISPFVGRLDDVGVDGMAVVEHAMRLKRAHDFTPLILLSSVRRVEHMKRGLDCEVDLITSPGKVYQEWFPLTAEERNAIDTKSYTTNLKPVSFWDPPAELLAINSVDAFIETLKAVRLLDIGHTLTDKGIARFSDDWKAIISS